MLRRVGFFVLLSVYLLYTPLPEYLQDAPISLKLFLSLHSKLQFLPALLDSWGVASSVSIARLLWEPQKWIQAETSHLGVRSTDTSFNGVPVRVYTPQEAWQSTENAAIFYMHGGGFTFFDLDSYDEFCTRLAAASKAVVVSVHYRRAPEFLFPSALDDCESALRHLAAHAHQWRVSQARISLAGDSAGGGLAAALALRVRDSDPALLQPVNVKYQFLIYPSLQTHNICTLSAQVNARDFMLTRQIFTSRFLYLTGLTLPAQLADYSDLQLAGQAVLQNNHSLASPQVLRRIHEILPTQLYDRIYTASDWQRLSQIEQHEQCSDESTVFSRKELALAQFYEQYIFDSDYSPLLAQSLSRLPPTYILVCEFDILRDDGLLFAERLKLAGVDVHVRRYSKYHPFALLEPRVPVQDFADFVLRHDKL